MTLKGRLGYLLGEQDKELRLKNEEALTERSGRVFFREVQLSQSLCQGAVWTGTEVGPWG